jgi:Haem-degrading
MPGGERRLLDQEGVDGARAFESETKALAKLAQPGEDFYGITASNDEQVMSFAGGIRLKRGEAVVGAVGVSDGLEKQDQAEAQAGAKTYRGLLETHEGPMPRPLRRMRYGCASGFG